MNKTYIDLEERFSTKIIDKNDREWTIKCDLDATVAEDDEIQVLEVNDLFLTSDNRLEYYTNLDQLKKLDLFDKKTIKDFENECCERILEDRFLMRSERLNLLWKL